MGLLQSQPMVKSPSAAFGRLRIDSPKQYHHHHRHLRTLEEQIANLHASPLTEVSPLIMRKLESLPSSESISPPVYIWIGPALICALAYALYNIFIKKGSASIHPILGGVILQFVAAFLGSLLLSFLVVWTNVDLTYNAAGIQWAAWAGVAVGAAEILSFCVSGMGVQAMQSIPIIIGGSVLFGTTLGYAVLHEALTARGWTGVFLIAAGITLVGINPGGAGSVH